MIAYALRTIVGLILAVMITLMVCGVLFLYERISGNIVFGKVAEANTGKNTLRNVLEEVRSVQTAKTNVYTGYEGCRIILDPGHGGIDGGTQAESTKGDVVEKDINLAVERNTQRRYWKR